MCIGDMCCPVIVCFEENVMYSTLQANKKIRVKINKLVVIFAMFKR